MAGAGAGGGFLVVAVRDGGGARGLTAKDKAGPSHRPDSIHRDGFGMTCRGRRGLGETHLSFATDEEGFFGARRIEILFAVELFELGFGIEELVEFADDVFMTLRGLIDAGITSEVIKASANVTLGDVFDGVGNEDVVKRERAAQSAVNEEERGGHAFILG